MVVMYLRKFSNALFPFVLILLTILGANPARATNYRYVPALTGFTSNFYSNPGESDFFPTLAGACQSLDYSNTVLGPRPTPEGGFYYKSCAPDGGPTWWGNNSNGRNVCTCSRYQILPSGEYRDGGNVTFEGYARRYCPLNEPVRPVFVSEETPFESCLYASAGTDVKTKLLSLAVLAPIAKEIRPAGTGGNSTVDMVAKVIDGTILKAGVDVQLTAEVIVNSGGHDHQDAIRPKGVLSQSTGTTDSNGEIQFKFTSTQIAGLHSITAVCNDCINKTATEKITVRIPDLVNIFTLPYRDAQWAYPGIGEARQHSDQHYLTVAAAARILDISRKVQKIWPAAPKLTLNDASLVWGGKFDIKGTWEINLKAHAEYRIGENIDIRANTRPGAVPPHIREEVFRWLRKASRPADNIPPDFVIDSVTPLWENPGVANEHFHLRLGI
jgi:hypothetical protein